MFLELREARDSAGGACPVLGPGEWTWYEYVQWPGRAPGMFLEFCGPRGESGWPRDCSGRGAEDPVRGLVGDSAEVLVQDLLEHCFVGRGPEE